MGNLSTTNTSFAIPALLTTTALFASKTAILNRQEAITNDFSTIRNQ